MLLTSAGIRNEILSAALADLVGTPFAEASVAFIPTASVADAGDHGWLVEDLNRLHGFGWRELDILELNGLPRQTRRRTRRRSRRREHAKLQELIRSTGCSGRS